MKKEERKQSSLVDHAWNKYNKIKEKVQKIFRKSIGEGELYCFFKIIQYQDLRLSKTDQFSKIILHQVLLFKRFYYLDPMSILKKCYASFKKVAFSDKEI